MLKAEAYRKWPLVPLGHRSIGARSLTALKAQVLVNDILAQPLFKPITSPHLDGS